MSAGRQWATTDRAQMIEYLCALLRVDPCITAACKKLGLDRSRFYDWRRTDSALAERFAEAIAEGEEHQRDQRRRQYQASLTRTQRLAANKDLKPADRIQAERLIQDSYHKDEDRGQRREAQRVELSGVGGDALVIRCVLPGAEPETDEVAE